LDGPRHDSRTHQIRFLFAEIEIGRAFVDSARHLDDQSMKAQVLQFAQRAHDTTARLLANAPVTQNELRRLERGLETLRQAIDKCSRQDGGT
jgi:hypothetical protein